jgi:outer membrane protein insertion porin family
VTVDTPEAQGTSDQVDVNLTVVEKPTGNFMIGGAFSQAEKFTFTASIQQANFAGSGNTVGLELNTRSTAARSRSRRPIRTSPTTASRARFELYLRTTRPPALNIGSYTVKQKGGRITFGVPFSEVDTVFFGAGLERTRSRPTTSPTRFQGIRAQNSATRRHRRRHRHHQRDAADGGLGRDSRDSASRRPSAATSAPTSNSTSSATQKYYRAVYEQQWYRPLTRWMTLALKGELDYGRGMRHSLPGLQELLRRRHRFGARLPELLAGRGRPDLRRRAGRRQALIGNAELQFPFPGSGQDRSCAGSPSSTAARSTRKARRCALFRAALLGRSGPVWISPVGPLKLSYAKPLNAKPGDRLERFQFQMGTGFCKVLRLRRTMLKNPLASLPKPRLLALLCACDGGAGAGADLGPSRIGFVYTERLMTESKLAKRPTPRSRPSSPSARSHAGHGRRFKRCPRSSTPTRRSLPNRPHQACARAVRLEKDVQRMPARVPRRPDPAQERRTRRDRAKGLPS